MLLYSSTQTRAGESQINTLLADRGDFWWSNDKSRKKTQSTIELSEKFFEDIIHHPVPLDLHILKALKRSSLGLDLYLWINYRTFRLDRPLRLPWAQLYRQFGADPTKAGDNVTVQKFRKDCLRELVKIKLAWPGLDYATPRGALGIVAHNNPVRSAAPIPAPSPRERRLETHCDTVAFCL